MSDAAHEADAGFVPLPDGGRLAYAVRGAQGPGPLLPILLVRPLGGAMPLWGSFRDRLTERFRVVSFDARGSGRSSSASLWTTTRSMARDAVAVLDYLRIAQAHVFGLSLGGMVSTWIGRSQPQRVARLVLASTPPRGLDLSRSGVDKTLSLARCFLRPGAATEVCLVRRVLSHRFRRDHLDELRRIEGTVRAAPSSRAGLLHHVAAAGLHDARAALPGLRVPALVLAGEIDAIIGRDVQIALKDALPDARFDVITGSGHDLSLEAPAVTADRVADFFLTGK